MGGSNPYIEKPEVKLPTTKYTVRFLEPDGKDVVVEVDPARIPYQRTSLPGSILDIALGAGIGIDHACGGVCACSTCHVHVIEGLETCSEATEDEGDELDLAPDLTIKSRLSCQCVPDGTRDIVVEVPLWNRNLIKEKIIKSQS